MVAMPRRARLARRGKDSGMKHDRYQAEIDPPREDLPSAEQIKQWAIEEAEWRLKEEPFAWEEDQ